MPVTLKSMIRAVNVLLAEDNRTDAFFIKEALKQCRLSVRLATVYNGEEALAYLRHQGNFALVSDPDLILLDLNLPKKNGWEVLTEIKGDPRLNGIPVLIITTSGNETDARRAYQLNVESYIVKPTNMNQFPMLLKSVERVLMDQFQRLE